MSKEKNKGEIYWVRTKIRSRVVFENWFRIRIRFLSKVRSGIGFSSNHAGEKVKEQINNMQCISYKYELEKK